MFLVNKLFEVLADLRSQTNGSYLKSEVAFVLAAFLGLKVETFDAFHVSCPVQSYLGSQSGLRPNSHLNF